MNQAKAGLGKQSPGGREFDPPDPKSHIETNPQTANQWRDDIGICASVHDPHAFQARPFHIGQLLYC